MEDTPGDHQAKIESKKSTGSQDGAFSSCTSTHISSDNNSCAKTLIEYDMDESLDIKEEIVQEQQPKRESNKSTGSQDGGPSSYTPMHISSVNNSGAKTVIEYDIDESLDIKEEIVQDEEVHQRGKRHLHSGKNQSDKNRITTVSSDNNSGVKALIKDMHAPLIIKEEIIQDQQTESELKKSTGSQDVGPSFCTPTPIPSVNNSGAKTLIEYDIDESLDIKEEIFEDQQAKSESIKSTGSQDVGPSSCTLRHISSSNNSGAKTLIEYDIDESLDIKEEIHGQGSINQELDEKDELKRGNLDTREADITKIKEQRSSKKEKIQESKSDPKKKYKCETCARSYSQKGSLNKHKKLECGVMPQFSCEFCGQKSKRKEGVKRHILKVHRKEKPKASPMIHKCDKCSQSYTCAASLSRHKHLEHATVRPQFTCDFCGYQTNQKHALSMHINSRHFQKVNLCVRAKKYKCEKCARSYVQKQSLYKHKKFECGVMPQFICEFCGKSFKQKGGMNNHIVHIHQKTNGGAPRMRHNCSKCSRSYMSLKTLNEHERVKHAVVKPQFICDYCGFETKRKDCISQHITSRHFQKVYSSVPEKKYKCEKCARAYFQKQSLNTHKKFDCGVMRQFRCESCGKQFKRKTHMNVHIRRMHQKTNAKEPRIRHNCSKCFQTYSSLRALNEHKHVEHGVVKPQFICDYCGYQTKRKMYLSQHIASKHLCV